MGRSPCCEKAHINKGAWTKEEDDRLVAHIRAHGEGCWRSLPQAAGLQRCGKSCRLRWINYLRPDLKRGNFTREEDDLIIKLHSLLGNKWSLIAARLPGRTDNEIKNYWSTHIRRKLLSRGIDPSTHQPIRESPSEVSIPFAKGEDKAVVGGGLLREGERCSSEERCSSSLSQTLLLEEEQRRLGLNLDLCISLPHEQQQKQKPSRSSESFEGQRGLCFGCGLGVQKSKECKCNSSFLGLGIGVLDFRDLEMKL